MKIQSICPYKNNLFGIVLIRTKLTTFYYWKSILSAIERKINVKGVTFQSNFNHFRLKEGLYVVCYCGTLLNLQYWNDSQSSLPTDILSIELHAERVFVKYFVLFIIKWKGSQTENWCQCLNFTSNIVLCISLEHAQL